MTIYILALGRVMSSLDNWVNILAYSSGFAVGNIVGSVLETKMAIGTIMVRIVPKKACDEELAERAAKHGLRGYNDRGHRQKRACLPAGHHV
ncbi:MAG: DUF5698 domain-containing protein [Clostridia bacterium]